MLILALLWLASHSLSAQTVNINQAVQLYQSGQYQKSIELLEAHPITKESAFVLMLDYMKMGDSLVTKNDSLAQACIEKALTYSGQCDPQMKEAEELRGTAYTLLANCHSSMSIDCYEKGQFREALRLEQSALEIRKRQLGEDHPSYASSLSHLAKTHEALGHYNEAIRLTNEALAITERNQGKTSSQYAAKLNNLSVYYEDLGKYGDALRLCNQAIQIHETNSNTDTKEYAIALSNLATINHALGNRHEALRISRQVLRLKEQTVGKNSSSYALSLVNHSNYIAEKGNLEEAIKLASEALLIQKESDGMVSLPCATTIETIARYNALASHLDNAIKLQQAHLQIIEKILGKNHPDYILSANNLAFYHLCVGDYEEGARLATQAEEISRQVLDPQHIYSIYSKENLAFANFFLSNWKDVEKYSIEATHNFTDYMFEAFPGLSVVERKKLWGMNNGWFDQINIFASSGKTPRLVENAYDGLLLRKGLLLNSDMEMMRLIRESGDGQAMKDYERLANNRHQLQKIMQLPRVERGPEADSLHKAVTQLERQLSAKSKEFGDYSRNLRVNWKDIQSGLGKNDMAVEFCRHLNQENKTCYSAFVLTAEMKSPQIVNLVTEDELKRLMSSDVYASDELTKAIWEPVFSAAKGKRRVFFAPDGDLYRLGIEHLPAVGGQGLLSDTMEFYRLSSTRYLALDNRKTTLRSAVVFGGLEYDANVNTAGAQDVSYKSDEEKMMAGAKRSVAEDVGLRAGISYLPATKEEAADIGKMLTSAKIKNTLLTMSEGTEAKFKSLSGQGINLLHIATHGFFWTDKETRRLTNVHFLQADTRSTTLEDAGMARSGLLLAGANTAIRGAQTSKDSEDGILTAEEISQLDFRGMDLVVMSACQTGLGDISGDGVFGLQRGFKKAGANALLMSLWKVDDTATKLLMDEFYKNLTSGKNKHDSFIAAQQFLLTTEDGKFSKPRYWAAFILLDGMK